MIGEQAVAVVVVAVDVTMAEVAPEVVVAVDAAEAMAAITRTITTGILTIQLITRMYLKRQHNQCGSNSQLADILLPQI